MSVIDKIELPGQSDTYRVQSASPFAYGRVSVLFHGTSSSGATVCVKLFRVLPRRQAESSLLEEFFREIEVHKRLKHPNILPVLDFGLLDERAKSEFRTEDFSKRPFLILPMCKSGNLRSFMRSRDFLPFGEVVQIVDQVAEGIDASHSHGVIHGDIKPENILFSDDRTTVYLTDFGIAKYFAIEERITTWAGPVGGSIAYLSPEQIHDSKVSPRSDVYSLATVAYELLTGGLPVDTRTGLFQQMEARIKGNLIDPIRANPSLTTPVRDALLHGLATNRDDRPSCARDFAGELAGRSSPRETIVRLNKGADNANEVMAEELISGREAKPSRRIGKGIWKAIIAAASTILVAYIGYLATTHEKVADPTTFTFSGIVTSVDGEGIPNARVSISEDQATSETILTDQYGHFHAQLSQKTQSLNIRVDAGNGYAVVTVDANPHRTGPEVITVSRKTTP